MANMSYCRFQNTSMDLEECLEAINEQDIDSKEEITAGKQMFESFLEFCVMNNIVEEYNEDEVKALFDDMLDEEDE